MGKIFTYYITSNDLREKNEVFQSPAKSKDGLIYLPVFNLLFTIVNRDWIQIEES